MFADAIAAMSVAEDEIVLWSLGQAGFCLKTPTGRILYLDAYLSNCCDHLFGFRRMTLPPITAAEVRADYWLSTHSHADHLDIDALPVIARDPRVHFIGSPDCAEGYQACGLSTERYSLLATGDSYQDDNIAVRAIFADHGELAPAAVGLLITVGDISIYHAGDTALRTAEIFASLQTTVDIMLVPINGAFGNLDAHEACELVAQVQPRIAVGCHFWMFVEHGGDPAAFLQDGAQLPSPTRACVLAPGYMLRYRQGTGLEACATMCDAEERSE